MTDGPALVTTSDVPAPELLTIAAGGGMDSATGHYDKRLAELDGVYVDHDAYARALSEHGADHVAYRVDEHRLGDGPGALVIGTSTVEPGRVGEEFAMTRGHLHRKSDRAELYHCLSGTGVMLMDTVDGRTRAIQMSAGEAVHVPGEWIHRSVNVGSEPLVMLFCYGADAGQDYQVIADAGGMVDLVVADADGWTTRPNPRHVGYRSNPS